MSLSDPSQIEMTVSRSRRDDGWDDFLSALPAGRFHIKMGAAPKLLPPALICIPNPSARAVYRASGRIPGLTALLRKVTMGFGQG